MNAAKPIQSKEYESFRKELYVVDKAGQEAAQYVVQLALDPGQNPGKQNERVQKVQSFKDRTMVILNRSILAEAYWKSIVTRIKLRYDAEYNRAFVEISRADDKNDKALKTVDGRKAMACDTAGQKVVEALKKSGTYEDNLTQAMGHQADAFAFLQEVKTIYSNLQDTSMALAQQTKNTMVDRGIGAGAGSGGGGDREAVGVGIE